MAIAVDHALPPRIVGKIAKALPKKPEFTPIFQAAEKLRPKLRRQFLAAVEELRSEASVLAVAQALEVGDIDGVLRAINVDGMEAKLTEGTVNFRAELIAGFQAGAEVARAALPKAVGSAIRFDMVNPRAVTFLRNYTFNLIREISAEQKAAVRETTLRAIQQGGPVPQQARIIRQNVGLTRRQARAVDNFREQLVERTDAPGGRRLTPAAQRRLSAVEQAVVRRHLRTGHLNQTKINALVERYRGSLVNRRALNIARTESIRASNAGQQELWLQAQEQGLLDNDTKRQWVFTPDSRVRDTHRAVPGMNPGGVNLNEPFKTPLGPSNGPPLEVNCRCTMVLALKPANPTT